MKNEAQALAEKGNGEGHFHRLVIHFFPKTIRRLTELDRLKRLAELNRYKYCALNHTRHWKGGGCYIKRFSHYAREYNKRKYFWMKPIRLIDG